MSRWRDMRSLGYTTQGEASIRYLNPAQGRREYACKSTLRCACGLPLAAWSSFAKGEVRRRSVQKCLFCFGVRSWLLCLVLLLVVRGLWLVGRALGLVCGCCVVRSVLSIGLVVGSLGLGCRSFRPAAVWGSCRSLVSGRLFLVCVVSRRGSLPLSLRSSVSGGGLRLTAFFLCVAKSRHESKRFACARCCVGETPSFVLA